MPILPSPFVRNISQAFGERGQQFLIDLPALIKEASDLWGLEQVQAVANLSYNFVAFATRKHEPVILKIGVPNPELGSEILALRLFNGVGACKLLEYEEEKGFLLIERLTPGQMLAELPNDDERTQIAVEVMQKIWQPAPQANSFIQLEDWLNECSAFSGQVGTFSENLLKQTRAVLPDLLAEDFFLLHGDFHHFNILSSDRGWLVIDPKGVIGPRGYEVGALMLNPWDNSMERTRFKSRATRRVDILHEGLGWERESILHWAQAHAILSAWWDYPAGDWQYGLRCAEIFSELRG